MINLIEEKFSSLISDQKLAISDEPFLIENFIDIKKYISSENILNDAINSDSVFWDIYDTAGPKLEIPFKRPYWSPTKQQHKLFIMEAINAGCTYVILKCSTLNEKLKRLNYNSKLETEIRFGDGEQYISLIFLHREIPLYQRTSRAFTVEKHSLGRLVTMYLDDE